jgi:trehalose 6-phosphate phosphatase
MSGMPLSALELHSGDALFLDLDGTLADIRDDPDAVAIPPETVAVLRTIGVSLDSAIVVLSGRDIRDLAKRTPDFVWRAGGHGLETIAPGEPVPDPPEPPPGPVVAALREAERHEGVWLELKGPVAALHYRAAPEAEEACVSAARAAVARGDDLVLQRGKMVVEVKPAHAHKGEALRRLCRRAEFSNRRPIMVGDDTTDEDAMSVAIELHGVAVKIGAGETVATIRMADPAALRAWLAAQAERLGG